MPCLAKSGLCAVDRANPPAVLCELEGADGPIGRQQSRIMTTLVARRVPRRAQGLNLGPPDYSSMPGRGHRVTGVTSNNYALAASKKSPVGVRASPSLVRWQHRQASSPRPRQRAINQYVTMLCKVISINCFFYNHVTLSGLKPNSENPLHV